MHRYQACGNGCSDNTFRLRYQRKDLREKSSSQTTSPCQAHYGVLRICGPGGTRFIEFLAGSTRGGKNATIQALVTLHIEISYYEKL